MTRTWKVAALCVALVVALGASTGCRRVKLDASETSVPQTLTRPFALEGATTLKVDISQAIGELTVLPSAAATRAIEAAFTYAPQEWLPEVSSTVEGSEAVFTVRQPEVNPKPFASPKNSWKIALPANVPTDLSLQLGMGTSDIDLRGVDVTRLNVVTDVGDTTIDLSGARESSMTAYVESGVGELTLRLPRSVGVRVTATGDGVGTVHSSGFDSTTPGVRTNAAWAGSGPKIDIRLSRGVGDIRLVLVD